MKSTQEHTTAYSKDQIDRVLDDPALEDLADGPAKEFLQELGREGYDNSEIHVVHNRVVQVTERKAE